MKTNSNTALSRPAKPFNIIYMFLRGIILFLTVALFLPDFNPGRIIEKISKYCSIFTSAVSYNNLVSKIGQGFTKAWVTEGTFRLLQISSALIVIGVIVCGIGGCMSLGNNKMRNRGIYFPISGSVIMGGGLLGVHNAYVRVAAELTASGKESKLGLRSEGWSFKFLLAATVVIFVLSIVLLLGEMKQKKEKESEMLEKYKLFLYLLPILLVSFIFAYLPLWGWRYAFFDYKAGGELTRDSFVGFKWFRFLFESEVTRQDIFRVLKNTLAMSGFGILTSWLPIAFAIFLSEIRSTGFRKTVQILTTIPNFISWVLVYAIAFSLFSTEGFVNDLIEQITGAVANTNYLQNDDLSWLKMLLWGTWKGLGWSAIVYIAAVSGVDQSLYEAAMVDGAGRFKRMVHITVPALIPTYCVMLMLSIANILSNGMEQYLVFSNAINKDTLEVLDLYVYNLGIGGGQIPLSTVVSMAKSLISVTLLFFANSISKLIRGESII